MVNQTKSFSATGEVVLKMSDTEFYRPDGSYSWRLLAMVILNSFTLYGFTVGTTGVLSEIFPDLFDGDQGTSTIIPSLFVAVFLFASKYDILHYFYEISQSKPC